MYKNKLFDKMDYTYKIKFNNYVYIIYIYIYIYVQGASDTYKSVSRVATYLPMGSSTLY